MTRIDEVKGWSRQHSRQFGEGGAQAKVALVESTLHHLMNDVGVKGAHGEPEGDAAPSTTEEAAPPPDPAPSTAVSLPPPAN